MKIREKAEKSKKIQKPKHRHARRSKNLKKMQDFARKPSCERLIRYCTGRQSKYVSNVLCDGTRKEKQTHSSRQKKWRKLEDIQMHLFRTSNCRAFLFDGREFPSYVAACEWQHCWFDNLTSISENANNKWVICAPLVRRVNGPCSR